MWCRDVFNERPVVEEGAQALQVGGAGGLGPTGELPHGAIIRTTRGDIWVKLFSEEASGETAQPLIQCSGLAKLAGAVVLCNQMLYLKLLPGTCACSYHCIKKAEASVLCLHLPADRTLPADLAQQLRPPGCRADAQEP